MRQDNMHEALMKSAIHVVAEQGIHKATTKALSKSSGVNEAYIYRLFGGKEDLLKKTFASLDAELVDFWQDEIAHAKELSGDTKQIGNLVTQDLWRFVQQDREKCLFFIGYYYSHYYMEDYSAEERKHAYEPVLLQLDAYMIDGEEAWEAVNHIYDVVFPTASRVLRGEIENNPTLEKNVCRRVYAFLDPILVRPATMPDHTEEGEIS